MREQLPFQLARYEAVCRSLAELVRVDEVKNIRDEAAAMQCYAMQAKDRRLIEKATEIRLRAERRAGELLRAMEKNAGARERGVGRRGINAVARGDRVPTLADLGISKSQSSRWQRLARLSEGAFEARVAAAKRKMVGEIEVRGPDPDGDFWLTPPDLYARLDAEFGPFDFDPCPFPRSPNFDGLTAEWGWRSFCNPPFGITVNTDGKKIGPTAWARKCIGEVRKGKSVVLVYPIDRWVLDMIREADEVRDLGCVEWLSTTGDGTSAKSSRPIACFVLRPHHDAWPQPVDAPMPRAMRELFEW